MAVTQQSYLDNSSSVKAARKKLQAAKAALADAKKAKEGLARTSGNKQISEQINQRLSDAQAKFDLIAAEVAAVEDKAKAYFNKNKETINAEAAEQDAAKEKAANEAYANQIARMKKAGLDTTAIENQAANAKKKSVTQARTETETGEENVVTAEGQNNVLDRQFTNARVYLGGLKDSQRLQLAKVLTDAGFPVPALGGLENLDVLTAQYKAALTSAKTYNTTNAELIKNGTLAPVDITGFLTEKTSYLNQVKGLGGAGGKGGADITQRISDPTQAASVIQGVFSQVVGRDATDQEVSALTQILNDFEKKNPFKTVDGRTTGGLDRTQFITDLIKKGTYAGNAKAFPKTLKKVADEIAAKKAGGEEKTRLGNRQNILDTAINNGIKLADSQIEGYLAAIKAGKSVEQVQQDIRGMNALGMPDSIKKLIDAGNDLNAILSPYRRAMATSLGINENTIDVNDPTLRMAIGPDKEMSLYDFRKAVRQDNRWKYSEEANDEVTNMINQVKRDFGFMG